jgi:hypothetical protein
MFRFTYIYIDDISQRSFNGRVYALYALLACLYVYGHRWQFTRVANIFPKIRWDCCVTVAGEAGGEGAPRARPELPSSGRAVLVSTLP